MALIKCPECGKEYSDTAIACPNCGYRGSVKSYGEDLGKGVKEGMKGLNTVASPCKRMTCVYMIIIPLILFLVFFTLGILLDSNPIAYIGLFGGLCLGLYQFYVGKVNLGIIYCITFGGLIIGVLIDLFKLLCTKTFRDSNGFPLIY